MNQQSGSFSAPGASFSHNSGYYGGAIVQFGGMFNAAGASFAANAAGGSTVRLRW